MSSSTIFDHARLQAIRDRFARAEDRERAAMVLRALGARETREGWEVSGKRRIAPGAAPYYATDRNALAAAERQVGLCAAGYGLVCSQGRWSARIADGRGARLRIAAAGECEARAAAVILFARLLRRRPGPAAGGTDLGTVTVPPRGVRPTSG